MNAILEVLNTEQKAAVVHTSGPLCVIAGAGTGKTRMLTHKIAYLITENIVKPEEILAVTFTNKAAGEMRERVEKLVGSTIASKVWISTYHSLCAKILRYEISKFGYSSSFPILDASDQKQILNGVYKKLNIQAKSHGYANMFDYISKNKMHAITPQQKLEEAQSADYHKESEMIHAKIYEEYEKELFRLKALDFDDLILFVRRLFKEHPDIAKKWAKKFSYILVDEYQDTSRAQFDIVKALAIKNNITVVGDPDQTIYTWRQAEIDLINNFDKYYDHASIIKLTSNYRSTKTIIDASNRLIKNNKNRVHKTLVSTKDAGENIGFYNAFSEEAEAKWIVQKIHSLRRERTQLKDIAIIYRAHYLSLTIEKMLVAENINYIIFGGTKFYQRQEIKDAISYLRIINNGDEVSLLRMINTPARSLGTTTVNKLIDFSQEKGMSLYDVIVGHFKQLPLSQKQLVELANFINLIRKYKKALETYPISTIIEKFLIEVKYIDSFTQKEIEDGKLDNVKELIRSIEVWEKEEANKNKTLEEYLDEVSLMMDMDTDTHSKDFVSLMTVHASKGLEFGNVFIAGFSDNIFPSSRALDEDDYEQSLEEERRLAYVAMTRAKTRLFISNSRGYVNEDRDPRIPSRFIKEIGIDSKEIIVDGASVFSSTLTTSEVDINYIDGDKVVHIVFGEGTVVKVEDELLTIRFSSQFGDKLIKKTHKSIEKVEKVD